MDPPGVNLGLKEKQKTHTNRLRLANGKSRKWKTSSRNGPRINGGLSATVSWSSVWIILHEYIQLLHLHHTYPPSYVDEESGGNERRESPGEKRKEEIREGEMDGKIDPQRESVTKVIKSKGAWDEAREIYGRREREGGREGRGSDREISEESERRRRRHAEGKAGESGGETTEANERAGEREKESSQYVLQFIWSFIRGSETERGRRGAEQKQSRDFQEKRCVAKINKNSFTPSLRPALSRHTIRAKHARTHTQSSGFTPSSAT